MVKKSTDFLLLQWASKPLHVVLYEHLHGGAVDRTRPLNRHAHAAADGHVRAQKNFGSRISDCGLRSPGDPLCFLHSANQSANKKKLGCQSGFFKLPVPAYSKSLYIGVSSTPGPFMLNRRLKSSLSSRK